MTARVERVDASAYTIPTEVPESDGTLEWDSTTIVVVEVHGGGTSGIGYSYTHSSAAEIVREPLSGVVIGRDLLDVAGSWEAMRRSVRNFGRVGIASTAISAVDTALWDLKARFLGLPLVSLLGQVRDSVPVYGSAGFTSEPVERTTETFAGWADEGFGFVKMKVGRDAGRDVERVRAAREAIGPEVELFVDANGAYDRKEALAWAVRWVEHGVTYFEEPISSDDLEGLRLLRDRFPPGLQLAAGEYGYDLFYFRRMLDAGAVDILQADITRCGGLSELLKVAALCEARGMPLSTHTAPALHAHAGCALVPVRHLEYFYDHVRIERRIFDGAPEPERGRLRPDLSRPGAGLEFKRADAESWAA